MIRQFALQIQQFDSVRRTHCTCGMLIPNEAEMKSSEFGLQKDEYMFSIIRKLTLIATMSVAVSVNGAGDHQDSLKVQSVESAWSIAQQFTGLSMMKNRSQTAMSEVTSLIQIETDNSPFLNEQIENSTIWEIKIGEAMQSHEFDDFDDERRKTPSGLTVWIDATTGEFLKAFTKYIGESPDLCPEPPAESATKNLSANETWTKFLDKVPQSTLMDALYPTSGSSLTSAKELIVHLIERSVHGNEPKPVWNLIVRGIEGGSGLSEGRHPCIDGRMRIVVDAATGRIISFDANNPMLLLEDLGK